MLLAVVVEAIAMATVLIADKRWHSSSNVSPVARMLAVTATLNRGRTSAGPGQHRKSSGYENETETAVKLVSKVMVHTAAAYSIKRR